jgi:lantibiotic transport system permease protein
MRLLTAIRVEVYKIRKTKMWMLLFISPLLVGTFTYFDVRDFLQEQPNSIDWMGIYSQLVPFHGMLLLPLLAGILSALICRYEHMDGGWKQLLVQPVYKYEVYIVKFILVSTMIAFIQLLILLTTILIGSLLDVSGSIPFAEMLKYTSAGWIATLPLIALQIWVSSIWANFAAPMALNVVMTLPTIVIAQSNQYGPYYPWAQPMISMIPREGSDFVFASVETLIFVILGSFLLFFIGGIATFTRKIY